MLVYFFTFGLALFLALFCSIPKLYAYPEYKIKLHKYALPFRKIELLLLVLIGIWLFCVSAFRDNVGIDFHVYEHDFNTIRELPVWQSGYFYYERGYLILNILLAVFFTDFQWVAIFCAGITVGLVIVTIYKYSEHALLSVLLYLGLAIYYASFCLIRQNIAVSIILCSFGFIKKKKTVKAILVVLFASLFHYSALVFIPVLLLMRVRLSKKFGLTIFGSVLILVIFFDAFVKLGVAIIPTYRNYLQSDYMAGMSIKSVIIPWFWFAVLYVFKPRLLEKDPKNVVYVQFAFFGAILSLFQLRMQLFDRFVYYFTAFLILSIPSLVSCFDTKFFCGIDQRISEFLQKFNKIAFFIKLQKVIHRCFAHFLVPVSRNHPVKTKLFLLVFVIFYCILYNVYVFSNGFYGLYPYEIIDVSELFSSVRLISPSQYIY